MLQLLHYLLTKIIDDPKSIKIKQEEGDDGSIVFQLHLPEDQRGKIIGKSGMNIRALRNVISIIDKREDKRVYLKVID